MPDDNNNNNEKPINLSVEPARMQRFNDSKFTNNKNLPKDIKFISEKQSMEASNSTIPKDIKNTNNKMISKLVTISIWRSY